MERVLWAGDAKALPAYLIPDEEIREFVEVCKYLECTIQVTDDGDDICFRADIPEDILNRGYIEYRNKVTDFEFKTVATVTFNPVQYNTAHSDIQGTIMTTANTFSAANNNATVNPETLAAANAIAAQMAGQSFVPAALPVKEPGLWDNQYVRYATYATGAVVVGVAGYYAYKHFTKSAGPDTGDIPMA